MVGPRVPGLSEQIPLITLITPITPMAFWAQKLLNRFRSIMHSAHAVEPDDYYETKLAWLLGIILVGVVAATFSASLGADFIWGDDTVNIYNNPHLRSLNAENLGWMLSDYEYVRRYMPLGWLGWALNYQLLGPEPWGFHLGNILFHAANAVLLLVVLYRLLGLSINGVNQRVRWICAWVGALLWAVHPFRVEAVAWASGRIYSQATLFLLLAILAYLKAAQDTSPQRPWYYWGAVAGFIASLLSYPIALGAVALFIALDFYPLRRLKFDSWAGFCQREVWIEKAPFAAAALAIFSLTLWARVDTTVFEAPPGLGEFGAAHRLTQAFYVWAAYIWKTWWPGALSPYYSALLDFKPLDWTMIGSVALVAGLSGLLWWRRRQWPAALAVWAIYLVMMVPMLGLSEHPHFANDRYVYIVAIGWSVLLAGLLCRHWSALRLRAAVLTVLFGMAGFWSVWSFRQCWVWVDTATLTEYAVNQLSDHPYRAKILMGYSFYHLERNEPAKAAQTYRRILEITPENPNAHCYLADLLLDEGRSEEAESHYRDALRMRPRHRMARQNLGVLLAQQERYEEATEQFKRLLDQFPEDAKGHHNLSVLLGKIGRTEEARFHSSEAERLRPAANRKAVAFQ